MTAPPPSVLRPDQTVWKIARADRAALLVDGARYFGALRTALAAARHSVFVLGWEDRKSVV